MRTRVAMIDHAPQTLTDWDWADAERTLHEAVSVLTDLGDERGQGEAWWLIGGIRFDTDRRALRRKRSSLLCTTAVAVAVYGQTPNR